VIDMARKRFLRQQFWLKRLGEKWRRPRGTQSKLRKEVAGRRRVKVGYGTPKVIRGKVLVGNERKSVVYVTCIADLAKVDKNKDVVIISSRIGKKKYIEILKRAQELGIKIYNVRKSVLKELRELEKKKKVEKEEAKAEKESEKEAKEKGKVEAKYEDKKGEKSGKKKSNKKSEDEKKGERK